MKNSAKKILMAEVSSAAVGAAVGGLLGVLFAPWSGKKSRAIVAQEGKKLAVSASKAASQVKKKASTVKKATKPAAKKKK